MRIIVQFVTAAFLVATCTLADAASPPAADEATLAVDRFHAALKSGDRDAATALLADNVVIYEEGEAELSLAQYASGHLQADIAYMAAVTETTVSRNAVSSSDMAWVVTRGRTTGQYHGRAVDRETTETMVLQRFKDGWKIVHIHWSSKAAA